MGAAIGHRELYSLWAGKLPSWFTSPLVCVPQGRKHPSLWVIFACIKEQEEQTEQSSSLAGDLGTLSTGLNASRCHTAVCITEKKAVKISPFRGSGLGPSVMPVKNTCWSTVPRGGSQCFQALLSSSPPHVGGEGHGSHVIQRIWAWSLQTYLAASTCWDAISSGRPQCLQTLSSSSPTCEGGCRRLLLGESVLRALRPT
jgi:hypothetical protein